VIYVHRRAEGNNHQLLFVERICEEEIAASLLFPFFLSELKGLFVVNHNERNGGRGWATRMWLVFPQRIPGVRTEHS